jgi:hypothetical protein
VNYFAHGRLYTHDAYFMAGTAVPDLLSVVDRRERVRLKAAQAFSDDNDPRSESVARGIVQHLIDDDWFHRTRAFSDLSWQLTVRVRDALPGDDGLRPRFLGHVLVEILLDAALIEKDPGGLDAYYAVLESVDPRVVQATVNRMAVGQTEKLAPMIEHFTRLRILSDYADDGKLLTRLNQVMRRVKLSELPANFVRVLSEIRPLIAGRTADLLTAEGSHEKD